MTMAPSGVDPRPKIEQDQIVGVRCQACGHPSAAADLRCRRCLGEVRPDRFGPGGVVWAAATVHLAIDHRQPPFTLASVDLDGGPRVLTLVDGDHAPEIGTRVAIVGERHGDVMVRVTADG